MNFLKGKLYLIFCVSICVLYAFFAVNQKIDISFLITEDISIHFNMITISSIFCSFMFGALTLMIGLNSSEFIKEMERAGYMNSIYNNLKYGMITAFTSILFSIIMVFIANFKNVNIKGLLANIELVTLFLTIIAFIKAFKDTLFIVNAMRSRMKYNKTEKDEINKILKKIQK